MKYYFTIEGKGGENGWLKISRGTAFDEDGFVIGEVGDYMDYFHYTIAEAKKLYMEKFNLKASQCVFSRM